MLAYMYKFNINILVCRNVILQACEYGYFARRDKGMMEAQAGNKSQVYYLLLYDKLPPNLMT